MIVIMMMMGLAELARSREKKGVSGVLAVFAGRLNV